MAAGPRLPGVCFVRDITPDLLDCSTDLQLKRVAVSQ